MGHDEVFIPFAVAAITPLGCAWVASRFVPPTNKWVYGGVVIGTAFLSWKYIVPRMLTSMGYPVPFEAESDYEESYDEFLDGLEEDALVLYKDNPSQLFEKAYPMDYEVGMNDYESSLLADIQSGYTENSKMFDEDENLSPYGEKVLKEMYDSLIDEALGIEWLASRHLPSELLKRGDPIAYGVGLSDYESSMEEDFEAESFSAEDCSHSNKIVNNVDEQGRHTNWPYWICTDCGKDWDYDAFCPQCGKANCPDKNECNGLLAAESFSAEIFEARHNQDGTIVLTDNEWNSCLLMTLNSCYLWRNKALSLEGEMKSGNKFKVNETYTDAQVALIRRYEGKIRAINKRKNAESFSAEPGWVSGPDAEPYPDEIDESLLEEYQQVIAEWEVVEGTPPSFKEYFNEAYWKAKEKYDREEEIAHNEYMEYLSTLTEEEAMEEMYGAETTATQRKWRIVKEYPHDITKEQHDEIIEALDYNDPNKEIFYVRYGDTIRILTPHAPINPILNGSFLPTFSAESFGADGPSRPCNAPDCNNPCYAKAQGQLSEGKPVMRYPYLCEECIIKFHPDVGAESFSAEDKRLKQIMNAPVCDCCAEPIINGKCDCDTGYCENAKCKNAMSSVYSKVNWAESFGANDKGRRVWDLIKRRKGGGHEGINEDWYNVGTIPITTDDGRKVVDFQSVGDVRIFQISKDAYPEIGKASKEGHEFWVRYTELEDKYRKEYPNYKHFIANKQEIGIKDNKGQIKILWTEPEYEWLKDLRNAESKFKPPYEGRHGFNPKRDTKGRYRRKLVVPLKKK